MPKRAAKMLKVTLDKLYLKLQSNCLSQGHLNADIDMEFKRRKKEVRNLIFESILSKIENILAFYRIGNSRSIFKIHGDDIKRI